MLYVKGSSAKESLWTVDRYRMPRDPHWGVLAALLTRAIPPELQGSSEMLFGKCGWPQVSSKLHS
jgi:hypothetical protein